MPINFSADVQEKYLIPKSKNQANLIENGYITASAESLNDRILPNFLGALFVCNPFCEVVSVRLEEGKWLPPLENVQIYTDRLHLMDVSDPLFLEMFPEKSTDIKKTLENLNKISKIKKKSAQLLAAKLPDKQDQEKERKPPKTAFNNGFRANAGLEFFKMYQTSSSNVQKIFNDYTGNLNLSLGFGYMRGRPLFLPKVEKWMQFEFNYNFDVFSLPGNLENQTAVKTLRNDMNLNFWVMGKGYKWGPFIHFYKQSYELSENQLSSYSYDDDLTLMGLAYRYQRWTWEIEYAYKIKINEQQPFRDQLKSATTVKLDGNYCSVSRLISGFRVTPCYNFGYTYATNDSTYKAVFNPTDTVNMTKHEIWLSYVIRFGEDFLR